MNLRPYQQDAVEAIRQRYREGASRVLCIAPTGAGKTVLFSHIAGKAVERGSRVVVIAHRRELVQQASSKLTTFGLQHGIIQAGFRARPDLPVQVASIQTLRSKPGILERVDLIIVDEAHHITPSNGYSTVFGWFPEARVLGVTATPWRLDGKGLGDLFPAHVVAATPRQLRDEGYLVPVGGWEYQAIDTSNVRIRGGDFVVGELAEAASSTQVVGDIVSEWQQHAAGKRSVLFAVTIEHSRKMVEAFRKEGVPAEHVDGEMDVRLRAAILERLRTGETLVVCNVNVLSEGFDLPELECVILARPTLSTVLYLQQVGRALRPAPGKTMARIHDHAGCLAAHGHPYMDRDYSPEESARKRRGGPRDAPLVYCKECKAVVERFPCDACGYSPPREAAVAEAPAAAKREITADGTGNQFVDDVATRRARWERKFARDPLRQEAKFYEWAAKHGLAKGCRVFAWFSGYLAQPRVEWIHAARRRVEHGDIAA